MAKIKFDIKYRPQIESGEYKVVTRDGRPARIICWDRESGDESGIVALIKNGTSELIYSFKNTGKSMYSDKYSKADLFIITPESELAEDERIRKNCVHFLELQKGHHVDTSEIDECISYLEKQKESLHISETCKNNGDSFTSEDERIRKWLIDYFDKVNDEVVKEDRLKIIAYLEKQKEQKHAECNKESKDKPILTILIDALKGNAQLEWALKKAGVDVKRLVTYIEEQKSAEWREDYREEDLRTRFAFYTYKDEDDVLYLSNVFVEETSRNKGFGTKILAAAEKVAETLGAINIRLKVKKNSPANAWYRKNGYGYLTFEGDYDWLEKTLEYLKPSKKEWSEEDEKMRNLIVAIFEVNHPDGFFKANELGTTDMRGVHTEEIVSWLKSIRPQPHWKPSKEQMEALENEIKFELSYGPHTIAGILQTLYDDLQKL